MKNSRVLYVIMTLLIAASLILPTGCSKENGTRVQAVPG